MVSVHFHDSGEVWEFSDSYRLRRKDIDTIFSNIRWFRESFPDKAEKFSYAVIKTDGYMCILIGMTDDYELISRYRKGNYEDYRRCYHA